MDGLSQIRARIAEIESFLPVAPQPATSTAQWASAATAAGLVDGAGSATGNDSATVGATNVPGLGATTAAPSQAAAAIVDRARTYLGVPYLWGGTDPAKGLDCSGFTQLVYRSQGIDLPRVSSQQATAGRPVGSLADAQPGDLLFFDYSPSRPGIDHVGIYVGNGQMVAAPQPGDVVKLQSAGQPTVIRRVLPEGSADQ